MANTTTRIPLLGQEPIGQTDEVIDRMHNLHNGTIMDYDGTADADLRPGLVSQLTSCNTSGKAYYATVVAMVGENGTLTKTLFAGGTETCTARCIDITPISSSLPGKDVIRVMYRFRCKTSWA